MPLVIPRIELPRWAELFNRPSRFKVIYGGRGSSKSWTIARELILKTYLSREFILCAREIQLSIRDSSKRVVEAMIESLGLQEDFRITESYIDNTRTGSRFIFCGLHGGAEKLRSAEGITVVWVDEANTISQDSLETLLPTIRVEGSEIWFTFNPQQPSDPVYQMFIANDPPPGAIVRKVNWDENPWFPEVLREQMEWDRGRDPDKFRHVWGGEPLAHSESQVFFRRWKIAPCPDPGPETPLYHGADWGFANDPSTLVRCWFDEKKLYVDRAAYGYNVETDNLPAFFETVSTAKTWEVIADSSRPEIISYLRNHGFPRVRASAKGKGSVVEGVEFLKNYEIIISPDLKNLIDEFSLYSYKVDARTGQIMPIIEDKNNHGIDALRYAVEPALNRHCGKNGYFMPTGLPSRRRQREVSI